MISRHPDRASGPIGRALEIFGRVPFFYYLLHIPLIHVVALIVWRIRNVGVDDAAFKTAPYVQIAESQRWELWLLYVVFAIVVAILYVACRWYPGSRRARRALGSATSEPAKLTRSEPSLTSCADNLNRRQPGGHRACCHTSAPGH